MKNILSIVGPVDVNLTDDVILKIKKLSGCSFTKYPLVPKNNTDLIFRIKDADAILVSFDTTINSKIADQCPNLKYIGICGTNLKNIDIEYMKLKGITVTNVFN